MVKKVKEISDMIASVSNAIIMVGALIWVRTLIKETKEEIVVETEETEETE